MTQGLGSEKLPCLDGNHEDFGVAKGPLELGQTGNVGVASGQAGIG
jgi:hypothetical protein